MKLLPRVALLTLILVNTPIAAKSIEACPGSARDSVVISGGHQAMPCLSGEKSAPVKQSPGAPDLCIAASAYDRSSLVDLHRSIRDGGLGALRRPSSVSGAATAAPHADLADCRVG